MASVHFYDPIIYMHGYDLTGDLHSVSLQEEAEELDNTTFGTGGYRSRIGGLKSVSLSGNGYWQSSPDAEIGPNLGTTNRVVTINHDNTETSPARLIQVGHFKHNIGGSVGGLMPFDFEAKNTDPQGAPRGQVAKKKGDVSATGAIGSGLLLGAVSATQYLYATFHVFSAGTTITVVVESDDNAGFTTATTRGTIGPLTTTGGTWMTRVAGAITDTYFRFRVTAITGTFSVGGAIAVA